MILHNGNIIRDGTPAEVWADPRSKYAAEFLGLGNVMEGEIVGTAKAGKWRVGSKYGEFVVACDHKHSKGDKVHLLARPGSRAERSILRLQASQESLNPTLRTNKDSGEERSQSVANKLDGVVADRKSVV